METAGLHELSAVLAIARRGTFRAAAIDIGMSTTALSHMIGRLESQLGLRLFNRTTRSVSLTDAGRLFVEEVGPALQDIHGALQVVRSQRDEPSGTIRINAAPFAARQIISPLITGFVRRYPAVHIDLVTEARLVDIVADGFDIGVRVAALVPSDMIAVPLGRLQRYAIVASPGYVERMGKPQTPSDLFNHNCIRVRLPDGSLFRWRFEKNGEAVQIDVPGNLTLDETSVACAAAIDGIGIGCFMEEGVAEELKAGRLVRLMEDWTPPFGGLCLYYPGRRNLSAAMKAFLGAAREFAKSQDG
ncbi:LysR family transcriptional regulator [Rhizobium straminoryzae]|uniref:HTH-type transcriptional regulator TtuA n=1 Tax=Rhizobium straminoryzae TaxID=1387186 RepID=A0A549TB80_9HYPH|nr:LysR family transcriptional regulator [Rhizobium straminoryzae]TRL39153.1 LysR family transcriptional regulator [Rhizobium straminoryzae]